MPIGSTGRMTQRLPSQVLLNLLKSVDLLRHYNHHLVSSLTILKMLKVVMHAIFWNGHILQLEIINHFDCHIYQPFNWGVHR